MLTKSRSVLFLWGQDISSFVLPSSSSPSAPVSGFQSTNLYWTSTFAHRSSKRCHRITTDAVEAPERSLVQYGNAIMPSCVRKRENHVLGTPQNTTPLLLDNVSEGSTLMCVRPCTAVDVFRWLSHDHQSKSGEIEVVQEEGEGEKENAVVVLLSRMVNVLSDEKKRRHLAGAEALQTGVPYRVLQAAMEDLYQRLSADYHQLQSSTTPFVRKEKGGGEDEDSGPCVEAASRPLAHDQGSRWMAPNPRRAPSLSAVREQERFRAGSRSWMGDSGSDESFASFHGSTHTGDAHHSLIVLTPRSYSLVLGLSAIAHILLSLCGDTASNVPLRPLCRTTGCVPRLLWCPAQSACLSALWFVHYMQQQEEALVPDGRPPLSLMAHRCTTSLDVMVTRGVEVDLLPGLRAFAAAAAEEGCPPHTHTHTHTATTTTRTPTAPPRVTTVLCNGCSHPAIHAWRRLFFDGFTVEPPPDSSSTTPCEVEWVALRAAPPPRVALLTLAKTPSPTSAAYRTAFSEPVSLHEWLITHAFLPLAACSPESDTPLITVAPSQRPPQTHSQTLAGHPPHHHTERSECGVGYRLSVYLPRTATATATAQPRPTLQVGHTRGKRRREGHDHAKNDYNNSSPWVIEPRGKTDSSTLHVDHPHRCSSSSSSFHARFRVPLVFIPSVLLPATLLPLARELSRLYGHSLAPSTRLGPCPGALARQVAVEDLLEKCVRRRGRPPTTATTRAGGSASRLVVWEQVCGGFPAPLTCLGGSAGRSSGSGGQPAGVTGPYGGACGVGAAGNYFHIPAVLYTTLLIPRGVEAGIRDAARDGVKGEASASRCDGQVAAICSDVATTLTEAAERQREISGGEGPDFPGFSPTLFLCGVEGEDGEEVGASSLMAVYRKVEQCWQSLFPETRITNENEEWGGMKG